MDDEIEGVRLTVADVVFQAARQLVRVGSVMSAGTATDTTHNQPAGGVQPPPLPRHLAAPVAHQPGDALALGLIRML